MKKVWMTYLLFATVLLLQGQSGLKEFRKTINAYGTLKQFSFDVEVFGYETKTSKKAELIGKGLAKKQDQAFFSKFAESEMLQLEGKTVLVHHDTQEIDFFEYNMKAVKNSMLNLNMDALLDSLSAINDSLFVDEGVVNNFRRFVKKSPEELIYRTEYYIDPASLLIQKIIYYYQDSDEDNEIPLSSVHIYFKNFQKTATPAAYFAVSKFIQTSGKSFIAAPSYKGYKVNYHKSQQKH